MRHRRALLGGLLLVALVTALVTAAVASRPGPLRQTLAQATPPSETTPTTAPTPTAQPDPSPTPLEPVPAEVALPDAGRLAPWPRQTKPDAWPPASSPPERLVIQKIGLDSPIVPVGTTVAVVRGRATVVWATVPDVVAFHETAAYPGHGDNIVLNGHRDIEGQVFRDLDRLRPGDALTLYADGLRYDYAVTESLVVPVTTATAEQQAENRRLIGPWPEERVTLVTCTPYGFNTHRLIVIARPRHLADPLAGDPWLRALLSAGR